MLECKSGDVSLVLRKNQGGHDDERASTRPNRLLEDEARTGQVLPQLGVDGHA